SDLINLINETIDIIKHQAFKKDLELLLNISPDIPGIINVDPTRLKQILTNLLSNAVKFTEKGEVELSISFEDIGNNKGKFLFEVRDTGIGISELQRANLFNAFSQADNSTTRKYGGTGLGLVISNVLTKMMGGEITFDSKLGEGTTFRFTLTTSYDPTTLNTKQTLNFNNALICDDNLKNCLIIQQLLNNWGIKTTYCNSGMTCIDMLEKTNFDLLIIDYNMPYLDGEDTLKIILNEKLINRDKTKIIIIYTLIEEELLYDELKNLKNVLTMQKPIKMNELFKSLAQLETNKTLEPDREIVEKDLSDDDLSGGGLNILVAEDLMINMMLVTTLISDLMPKAKIIEAKNGEEAVIAFKKNPIHLILMDVQMPVMDGLEATREIRRLEGETTNRVPIIALTAGALQEEKDKAIESGMNDFLTKPIDIGLLKDLFFKYFKRKGEQIKSNQKIDIDNHFDYIAWLKSINNNEYLKLAMIETCKKSLPENLQSLNEKISQGNLNDVFISAHSIKGQANTMKFLKLSKLAAEIENLARQGNLEGIKEKFIHIKSECDLLISLLESGNFK
ncbi:MAG: response regulator, partial [Thermodesulfovibrionales bacterium]|nr:response regulator [Thermodesulfovibrionales bacterium]